MGADQDGRGENTGDQRDGGGRLGQTIETGRLQQHADNLQDVVGHENRPSIARYRVDHDPPLHAFGQRVTHHALAAGEKSGGARDQCAVSPLFEIGHLPKIRQSIVAVELHQGIGVEKNRHDTANNHDVESDLVEKSGWGEYPEGGCQRGQKQLEVNAAGDDHQALPFLRQHPAVTRVAEEKRRENNEHSAHLMHLASVVLASQPVPEFVHDLHADQNKPHDDQVLPTQKIRHARGEIGRVGSQ